MCNLKSLAFPCVTTLYHFTTCNSDLTLFCNAGEKVLILLLMVFVRLLNSFDSILRQETSTTL